MRIQDRFLLLLMSVVASAKFAIHLILLLI